MCGVLWLKPDTTFPINVEIDNVDKLEQYEQRFGMKSQHNVICDAVGALDGCLKWQKNKGSEAYNSNKYYCSKKENFSLFLMAISD